MGTPCSPKTSAGRLRWAGWAALALTLAPALAAQPPGDDGWKFDVLRLKNGKTFPGLLVGETPTEVRFQCVRRSPGLPTVVIATTFPRSEVESIDELTSREREQLAARLQALDPTGKGEALRMGHLELKPAPWGRDGRQEGLAYTSVHFVLVSNACEAIVRRAAVRLEQIYAAYTRFLPPRRQAAEPTTIVLVRSLAEYQALLRQQGRHLANPAFYDAARNQIVCACDLERLGDHLEEIRKLQQQQLESLKEEEAQLHKLFRGKIPAATRERIQEDRLKIFRAGARNDALFQAATRRLFQTLYHEAFHAYLAQFVYSPAQAEVPRWLNEGLAQIFETALLEAGELRVGHADADRLAQAKAAADRGQLVGLAELLGGGPRQFLVAHASDQQTADRYYLTSWGLAFYLTFERRLLGTQALDRYVLALKAGAKPLEAFEELVGQPAGQVEKDFHHYLLRLRRDGSTGTRP
jgi:hypothetical protein